MNIDYTLLLGQWLGRKEEHILFNDALNTFYLRLYGVGHMVKDHSHSERGNPIGTVARVSWVIPCGLPEYISYVSLA